MKVVTLHGNVFRFIFLVVLSPYIFLQICEKNKAIDTKEYFLFRSKQREFSTGFKLNDQLEEIYGWINFKNIENYSFQFFTDFSACPICNFKNHNPNVTRDDSKDLVISFLIGRISGVVPFIQSLRSTGSKAQIVLFVDNSTFHVMNDTLGSFIPNCGVHLIDMGVYKPAKFYRSIYYIKYFTASAFLNSHSGFDRILLSDTSDVIFQGNPFLVSLPHKNTVIACEECDSNLGARAHWSENRSEHNILKILTQIKKDANISKYPYERKYFNGGVFFAPEHLVRKHTNNVINLINKLNADQFNQLDQINTRLEEQTFHNFAINEYLINDQSITVLSDGPHHELFMLSGRNITRGQRFPNFQYKGDYVLLYHLIYQDKDYCLSIGQVCPPVFNFSNYFRC
ncbi:hypothetical protein TRFO_32608 [Tritrichomonas foetus]|uniref:Nucleotide-diphospho-sugar transferase domain-containing protein n=1 Tax=Tritrichomonas foetus TaxID=1144522 RepID=A0A1J4JNE6_9EUKA|nr:hypothetical protein TRFO_32608 [Tritrichomonas foetus]|eukprot:OHT00647.1 hypothetical protein TRFO_32608 [Tritrichomonas foetus]